MKKYRIKKLKRNKKRTKKIDKNTNFSFHLPFIHPCSFSTHFLIYTHPCPTPADTCLFTCFIFLTFIEYYSRG